MDEPKYEHRIVKTYNDGTQAIQPYDTPAMTGKDFRNVSKHLYPGESVEIQKRPVGEWTTVERREKPNA